MMGRYMSFQGLERFSVFQAYDVIIGHRAIDRNCGFRLFGDGLCHRRFSRSFQCSMNQSDCRRQVRCRQRVLADIGRDHLGRQFRDEILMIVIFSQNVHTPRCFRLVQYGFAYLQYTTAHSHLALFVLDFPAQSSASGAARRYPVLSPAISALLM